MESQLYNTYVIDTDRFKAVKLVASEVNFSEAARKEYAEERKWDILDYFVQSYPVGSDRDKECARDLIKSK
jgi:hypothetical protein